MIAAALLWSPAPVVAAELGSGGTPAAETSMEGAIRGRVTEEGSNAPVAGAQVTVVGTRIGAVAGRMVPTSFGESRPVRCRCAPFALGTSR